MNSLKRKVSLLLVVMMMLTSILPIFVAFAGTCEVTMTVKMGTTQMKAGSTYEVTGGEKINVNASSNAGIAFIGYRFVENGKLGEITDVDDDSLQITVPNRKPGTQLSVRIEAVANNDDGTANTITKTGWKEYILKYASESYDKAVSASINGKRLAVNGDASAKVGEKIDLVSSPASKTSYIYYAWDDENEYEYKGSSKSIVVPDRFKQGTTHTLYVTAEYEDGTILDWNKYYISIPEEKSQISMTVKMGNTTMKAGNTYTVTGGEKINVSASSNAGVAFIGYRFVEDGKLGEITDVDSDSLQITVPNKKAGSKLALRIEAVGNDDDGTVNTITKTGWREYTLEYPASYEKAVSASINGKKLTVNGTVTAKIGTNIDIVSTPADKTSYVFYAWDSEKEYEYKGSSKSIVVPDRFEDGTTHTLYVTAEYEDGTILDWNKYYVAIPKEETPVEPVKTEITVDVKYGSKVLSAGKTTYVECGDKLTIYGTSNVDVSKVTYKWDNGKLNTISAKTAVIEIPDDFEEDELYTLTVQAIAKDGTKSEAKEYDFEIDEYEEDDDEDELIIEPWMKENKDLNMLAVSLRNDSEEDKANKNIYALNEEVIYYVDYKNGGKDTSKKVTLVLNVPETFKVVKSDNGTVSTKNGTITWTFNGLEEDEAGTKTVVLKYTNIGGKKVTSKVIYPLAEIKLDNKVKDQSAVINLIYKDEDTEIDDTHYPYMFGDANATTFRPDDTIKRGEAALVLTRIFGISTSYDKSSYNYPDLDETYLEARKAIIAATEYGIINGYEDGTYRPNQAMTRAEFMKIIACRIAIENDDGFEIKDLDSSIKVYKDTTKAYNVNGNYITEHWALEEVSLLARLNMLPLTEKNKNLRLDEPITRAEVAQLVNFYLLRAPAEVTSKTKIQFSDVNRNHKLFADIVEATRAAHTYYITDETTEVAEF